MLLSIPRRFIAFIRHRSGRGALRAAGLAVITALAVYPSAETRASDAMWTALKQPDTVAVMRHALTPGTGDPFDFALEDCTTQRNLDARGRAQARAIGAQLRKQGLRFDRVPTSRWCRCRETATLLDVGPVEDMDALNSFFRDRIRAPEQTRTTLAFLDAHAAREKLILVTHQVNITALTGVFPASGEIVVGRIVGGNFKTLGTIEIAP